MPAYYQYLIALVCFITTSADAAHILGIFPLAARSHYSCNYAILKSLHAAGHKVTMISPFPLKTKIENFTNIDSGSATTAKHLGQITLEHFADLSVTETVDLGIAVETQLCEDVMKMKEIQEALSSTEKLYDVVFFETLTSYYCYLPIAEKLGVPAIGTLTLSSWKRASDEVGMSSNPTVIPNGMSRSKPDMNFFERVQNIWDIYLVDSSLQKTRVAEQQFYWKYFPEYSHHEKNVALVFFNNHPSLLPRSIPSNAIEIGGIHLQPAERLPENIQKFIDEAPHGVILFTFGSMVNASTLAPEKITAFLDAFASTPQRVIWKFEEPIENLPKNVMISKWLPQRDILEHKNVRAFMSHCGLSGVYEAIATGTPVVTIPLCGDQMTNAAILQWRKVGVYLDVKTVTRESVLEALNAIINDTSYYHQMQELSHVFNDRPLTPQESVVYWTEYVIRHNGASHLRALGADMPLHKYLMLDIIAVCLTILSIVCVVVYAILRKIHRSLFQKRRKKPAALKKRN